MLEYLSEWMKQIAYYMVLVTMVLYVTAGKSYERYIRMFTGIVLVLFVLSPVTKLISFDAGAWMDSARNAYETRLEEMEREFDISVDADAGESGQEEKDGESMIRVEEIQIGQ